MHTRLHDKSSGRGLHFRSDDSYDSSAYDSYDDRRRPAGVNFKDLRKDGAKSRKNRRDGNNRRDDHNGDDSEVIRFEFVIHFKYSKQ